MSVERRLDRALGGHPGDDPEIASLIEVARDLERTFTVDTASKARERAMFVAGVGARRRGPHIARFLVPALAVLLVIMLGLAGRVALPGDTLYPVRQGLQKVGLATSAWEAIDADIARAARQIGAAETALSAGELSSAEARADAAIAGLVGALEKLDALEGEGKISRVLQVTLLQDRAEEVIAAVERAEETPDSADRGPEPGRKGDDDADEEGDGDGNDDDDGGDATDGDDDNAGPGGGDDDNSGPGGGDDDNDGDDETLDGDDTADVEELDD